MKNIVQEIAVEAGKEINEAQRNEVAALGGQIDFAKEAIIHFRTESRFKSRVIFVLIAVIVAQFMVMAAYLLLTEPATDYWYQRIVIEQIEGDFEGGGGDFNIINPPVLP